jgi:hypothetical protein
VETLLANPILSAGFDLLEQLRRDDGARIELERLVEYLSGTNDEDDKSAALLVSGSDMLQLLGDETRLVPFLRSISEVTAGTTGGTASGGPATSAIDSLLSLLSRVSKRAYDAEGREQCHREIDPNQILVRLLRNAFTSSGDENSATETPIEVLADTLAEVNRAVPADTGRLRAFDYASIADNMAEFLLDDERGLEQLYAIMRQGTAPH